MAMPVHPPISRAHGCPNFLHPFQISVLPIFLIVAFTIGMQYYLIVLSSSDKGFTSVWFHTYCFVHACANALLSPGWGGIQYSGRMSFVSCPSPSQAVFFLHLEHSFKLTAPGSFTGLTLFTLLTLECVGHYLMCAGIGFLGLL